MLALTPKLVTARMAPVAVLRMLLSRTVTETARSS
jgi:hypothetical protein